MESRVEQFHLDAQRPVDKRTAKDIEKLRKFLYKNQEYRFTEREQSHLFGAVQLYVTAFAAAAEDDNAALPLLEDALKMPFTVFTTSQKKTMLKWLHKATGKEAASQGDAAVKPVTYQVIDVDSNNITLMQDDGETTEVPTKTVDSSLLQELQARFAAGEDLTVTLSAGSLQVLSS